MVAGGGGAGEGDVGVAEAAVLLGDAPAGGLQLEAGVGAAAAEEEAPEAAAVDAGAHLRVLPAADHGGVGHVERVPADAVGALAAAAEDAAGDDVDRGQLDPAVGGVDLGDVGLRRVAGRRRRWRGRGRGSGRCTAAPCSRGPWWCGGRVAWRLPGRRSPAPPARWLGLGSPLRLERLLLHIHPKG